MDAENDTERNLDGENSVRRRSSKKIHVWEWSTRA
ncbi:hypothetical protein GYH30_029533 [Glycine max]|nr:hypothetical protein GYH30_029533 [Glycine max]